jgi:hypothetical protein
VCASHHVKHDRTEVLPNYDKLSRAASLQAMGCHSLWLVAILVVGKVLSDEFVEFNPKFPKKMAHGVLSPTRRHCSSAHTKLHIAQ